MAEIRPLRAWRFGKKLLPKISELISPLFDVVSDKQRQKLYENPLNSIHLSVPSEAAPASGAGIRLTAWKQEGIIDQDALPAIYVYYQHFTLTGSNQTLIRKGFIANLRITDWHEGSLMRHERTIPFSVADRIKLLEQTQLNVSPTHGLYTDDTHEIERYLDESMFFPLYETEDYQGVRDVFSVIQDRAIIQRICQIMAEKKVILADGHHRYEGSLKYFKQKRDSSPAHMGNEGYNFHLMYFTNTESNDLRVLPTHRVFQNLERFSEEHLLSNLQEDFNVLPIENPQDVPDIICGKKWAFGLLFKENAYKIRLKPERIEDLQWPFPPMIKELDLTVLHYFLIEKGLGIAGKDQTKTDKIRFERNFAECLKEVSRGEAQFVAITQDISIDTIKKVCESGYTLPQKSTYFYPKVISGFLFSSIAEDEFHSPFDSCFR